MNDSFTFISGANGGLGGAFVALCAKNGENLFLTGRSRERLQKLTDALQKQYPNQKFCFFECDLTDEASRSALYGYATGNGVRFSKGILVAGADIQKPFLCYTQQKLTFQCRVNFEAAVSNAHFLIENKSAHLDLVVISSISGLYPMPHFALYSATKKAEQQFFNALRIELLNADVHVTTVMPGAIPTRPDVINDIRGQGLWGRLAALPPERVAALSLKAVKRNKATLIPGFWNNVMRFGTALIPLPIKMRFIAKRWGKQQKDAF